MSNYLAGDEFDDDDFVDEFRDARIRKKRFIASLFVFLGVISSTVAANITLNKGRIEMGSGIYRITACDQWVGIGLYSTAPWGDGISRVQSMELIGLDPRLCKNVIFRIKMFKNSDLNTPLPLFTGVTATDTNTASAIIGDVTQVSVYDTATVPSSFSSTPSTATYSYYAKNALTLVDMTGANIGYQDSYQKITYNAIKGTYTVYFFQPICKMTDVDKITIESSSLPS